MPPVTICISTSGLRLGAEEEIGYYPEIPLPFPDSEAGPGCRPRLTPVNGPTAAPSQPPQCGKGSTQMIYELRITLIRWTNRRVITGNLNSKIKGLDS